MLTRQQTLMKLQHVGHCSTFFTAEVDVTEISHCTIIFKTEDWRSMGAPNHVTLTLQPGDRLNGERTVTEEDDASGAG
jgi:hypothetical protein